MLFCQQGMRNSKGLRPPADPPARARPCAPAARSERVAQALRVCARDHFVVEQYRDEALIDAPIRCVHTGCGWGGWGRGRGMRSGEFY